MPHPRTGTRSDPACGTCRRRSRKCDRGRPQCQRCITKGLRCEGYPPRFQFWSYQASNPGNRIDKGHGPSRNKLAAFQDGQQKSALVPTNATERGACTGRTPAQLEASTSDKEYGPAQLGRLGPFPVDDLTTSPNVVHAVLDSENAQTLLSYFDEAVCDTLAIVSAHVPNPFRTYLLPLAYQCVGILHALLALSACHLVSSKKDDSSTNETASLRHKLSAIQSLSRLLQKEESCGLSHAEEETALAIVLLLVLHDVCESGISSHGAHLTGMTFLCERIAERPETSRSSFAMFLLAALAWLDVLRAFSGGEKLAYPDKVRRAILDTGDWSLETLVGCPVEIFYRVGKVLSAGKSFYHDLLSRPAYQAILDEEEQFLRGWNADTKEYPTSRPEWKHLAEAYRHAGLLRILRSPDPFQTPCGDQDVQAAVSATLDVAAEIPMDSSFYKRLLFPLFLAGADAQSTHTKHYVQLCINEIKRSTGFQHRAMTELLETVWKERKTHSDWGNVPWTRYTCSRQLKVQHAYLFF